MTRSSEVPGLFRALYAATALNQDEERKILSTDDFYDTLAESFMGFIHLACSLILVREALRWAHSMRSQLHWGPV